jgi:hypothetical protein
VMPGFQHRRRRPIFFAFGQSRGKYTTVLLRFVVSSLLLFALAEPVSALPIFARRYETSCLTCHVIPPKLNAFGIAFRNNGFRIPLNDEKFVKSPDIALGAPAWKKLWPKAVWPGSITGIPPIAIRVSSDVNIRPTTPVNVNFDFPNGITGYFAGSAGDSFSYFGSVFLSGATNQVFLDRAYGQFRLAPDSPGQNWLTLKLGRIDTRAEPFSSTFRRTTAENFGVSDFRVTTNGFAFRDHDAGIEAWGAITGPNNRGGVEYAAGIVQGTSGRPENNNFKDYYGAISYKIGGLGVVGSRTETDEQPNTAEGYLENSISFGLFAYRGKGQPAITGVSEDSLTRSGFRVDAWLGKLNVYGTAVFGKDELRGTSPGKINSSSIMGEADYLVLPWVMPTFRFEKTNLSDGRRNVIEMIPAVSILVRANVKILAEGHFFNRLQVIGTERTGLNEGLVRLEFFF